MTLTTQVIQRIIMPVKVISGQALNCDGCRGQIVIQNGYYHCGNQTCDWDYCKTCGDIMIKGALQNKPN